MSGSPTPLRASTSVRNFAIEAPLDVVWKRQVIKSPTWPRKSNGNKERFNLSIPSINLTDDHGEQTVTYDIVISSSRLPEDYSIQRKQVDFVFLARRLPSHPSCMKFPGKKAPVKAKTAFIEDPRRDKFEKWLRSVGETYTHPELLRFLSLSGYEKDESRSADAPFEPSAASAASDENAANIDILLLQQPNSNPMRPKRLALPRFEKEQKNSDSPLSFRNFLRALFGGEPKLDQMEAQRFIQNNYAENGSRTPPPSRPNPNRLSCNEISAEF